MLYAQKSVVVLVVWLTAVSFATTSHAQSPKKPLAGYPLNYAKPLTVEIEFSASSEGEAIKYLRRLKSDHFGPTLVVKGSTGQPTSWTVHGKRNGMFTEKQLTVWLAGYDELSSKRPERFTWSVSQSVK
jgi:hypothetical protein